MNLSNANIAAVVEDVQNFFKAAGSEHNDILKICLVVEEALLRYQEHFGESHEFELYTKKFFSTPKIVIRLKGKPFDPLQDEQEESIFTNEIMRSLLQYEAAGTVYCYENGCNELISFSTRERRPLKIPGGAITVAILLAITASFLVDFLSPDVKTILINDIVAPILSTLMELIVTVTVFMMFFSIVSSICAIEDTAMLGNIGAVVLSRIFLLMCAIIILAIFVSTMFFPVFSFDSSASIEIGEIVTLFLSIIPKNILDAFSESNVLQVTIMAFFTGVCIVKIGNRIPNVKVIVTELNVLIFNVMTMVFTIIPAVIFLCIFKTLSTHNLSEFFVVWRLVVAEVIVFAAVAALMIFYMLLTTRTNLRDFLKKVSPAVVIALTTSSSLAAFPKNLEIAEKSLHVEKKFCSFWLPIALVLFAPSILIEMVACAFYAASVSDVTFSVVNLLIVAFVAVQLSIATPKVTGGAAVAFTILLTQLDLPMEMIGTLMIANILLDNLFSAINVLLHDCELMTVATKMKFVKSK